MAIVNNKPVISSATADLTTAEALAMLSRVCEHVAERLETMIKAQGRFTTPFFREGANNSSRGGDVKQAVEAVQVAMGKIKSLTPAPSSPGVRIR